MRPVSDLAYEDSLQELKGLSETAIRDGHQLALLKDQRPLLTNRTGGRDISGLRAYER